MLSRKHGHLANYGKGSYCIDCKTVLQQLSLIAPDIGPTSVDENEGSYMYNSKLEPRMGSLDRERDEGVCVCVCVCVVGGGGEDRYRVMPANILNLNLSL